MKTAWRCRACSMIQGVSIAICQILLNLWNTLNHAANTVPSGCFHSNLPDPAKPLKHPESCCKHCTFRLNLPSLSMWLLWSCIYLLFQKVTLKKNKKKLGILHINASHALICKIREQALQVTTIQGWENTANTCLKTNYIHCNLVLVLKFSACKKDSANYWHLYCGQPGLQAPTFQSQVTLLNSVLPPPRFICLCTIWWYGVLSHLHDLVIWRSRVL